MNSSLLSLERVQETPLPNSFRNGFHCLGYITLVDERADPFPHSNTCHHQQQQEKNGGGRRIDRSCAAGLGTGGRSF